MTRSRVVGVLVIVLLFCLGAVASLDSRKTTYGNFIDKEVHQCVAKNKNLCTSKFPTLQAASAISCLKAAFLDFHKDELIEQMVEEGVGTKDYQMELFLNDKFVNILKKATYHDDSRT